MRITIRSIIHPLLAAGLAFAGSAQAAGHSYIPFTETLNSGGNQGVWLADTAHLGNPPYQLTNQVLDGSQGDSATVAILDSWTLDPVTHQATGVTPQLVVYGVHGQLYKANLKNIQPVQQFSDASYGELCSLAALDPQPYAVNKAYVQAVVEPVGSGNTCASGIGTQTWLIPANADDTVAPILEPGNWSVMGAFTDPVTGNFVRWIVWTGNEVDAYKANFGNHSTLLVGPPAGPAPIVLGLSSSDALIMATSDDGTTHVNRLYHLNMGGSGPVTTYSYPDANPCSYENAGQGAVFDAASNSVALGENTANGYAVYLLPMSGAAPTPAYADNTGNNCGGLEGDTFSGGYVGVLENNNLTGDSRLIGIATAGPAGQSPNVLYDAGTTAFGFIRYTIDGHFWITVQDISGQTTAYSVIVADGDGNVLEDYTNTRIGDDIWGGFGVGGPGVERDLVYLFSPNATPCTGGTLTAVDPAAFTGTNISGVPADACSALSYGWLPASVGYFQEGTGSSPAEFDPVGGKAYQLLGVDPNGLFYNLATLPGYPFY